MIEDPDFEQNYWSKTAEGIIKIRHDSIRRKKGYFIMIDHLMKIEITMIWWEVYVLI